MSRLRPINRPRRPLMCPLSRIRRSTGIHPPRGSDVRCVVGDITTSLFLFFVLFFLLLGPCILVVVDGEVVADSAVDFLWLEGWGGDWFGGHFVDASRRKGELLGLLFGGWLIWG